MLVKFVKIPQPRQSTNHLNYEILNAIINEVDIKWTPLLFEQLDDLFQDTIKIYVGVKNAALGTVKV